MNKQISSIITASALLAGLLTATVHADSSRHLPDARPDGKVCQEIPGGINGMITDTGIAGTTYYTDSNKPVLESGFDYTSPFAISLYDADGGDTYVTLKRNLHRGVTFIFNGNNNEWSQTYATADQVDEIQISFPPTHASTHVCVFGITLTQPVTSPTSLAEGPELLDVKHVYLPIGERP